MGVDASGRAYVECTVEYHFRTVTSYPGIPNDTLISRTVRMFKAPQVPNP
jgi:hypothetical protein